MLQAEAITINITNIIHGPNSTPSPECHQQYAVYRKDFCETILNEF